MSSDYPQDLKYTKEHEWLRPEGKLAVVGVTAFAAQMLGDVVAVELPEEGDSVVKGEAFGTIESVKSVADLFAPVSGKVVRVNSPLSDSPEYVNEDPYDEGWLIQVEISDRDELEDLMSAEEYAEFATEQE